MLLRLTKVAKFYGNRLVIKDVSFDIHPGTVTLLAGPNGAGKSTLLKLMAGLSRPSAGSVERGIAEDALGYLGHQTFIYPELTAFENLAFWARLHGLAPERCSEDALLAALERMELKRFAFERAGGFSRGMAQRLNLARVLLLSPSLLLLDEPGTGLDTRSMAILHREIAAARDRGAGIVWISHSVAEDLARADQVLAIAEKRVTYSGPAADYVPEAVAC
ncbi:ABC transporter ATP-binding protein [Nitratidesulfovibrio sp. SRB-5]|uniref:ABC transporter ATP-binding protein n=1 Tax=Nitratidesulfovibrio sp. SRB-5 TaxID=2872636 RepID=UPI00102754FC|nr:ABC transporter ATP-binding protein [Nitratidesulfovibrio sp. SRB-5]MBZ2171305.1 ABC transporter ATP-binding protein [Nitratidesulfovibrio sp. SRB-5]RXF76116.1 ABC transporter ATP-binding protein [Desulfovibrio sp. DS-1]